MLAQIVPFSLVGVPGGLPVLISFLKSERSHFFFFTTVQSGQTNDSSFVVAVSFFNVKKKRQEKGKQYDRGGVANIFSVRFRSFVYRKDAVA